MLRLQMFRQDDGDFTAWEMAEIDFGETELHVVCRNRDIATRDHGKAAAKHPAVDFRNHRLRHLAQDFVPPLTRFFSHLVAYTIRLRIHFNEVLLQILTGAKAFAGAGDHDHSGFLVVFEIGQAIIHFAMQLRAHGIAFLGPIQGNRRDAILLIHQQSLISCHSLFLLIGAEIFSTQVLL
jgi:hypothetical protein